MDTSDKITEFWVYMAQAQLALYAVFYIQHNNI